MIRNNKILVVTFILFFALYAASFSFCSASGMVFPASQDSMEEGCGHLPKEMPVMQKSPAQSSENSAMPCCVDNGAATKVATSGSQVSHNLKFYAVSSEKDSSFDSSIKNNPSSQIVQVFIPPPQGKNLTSIFKKE